MLQLWSHVDHDYDKIIRMFKQEYSNKNDRINKTIMLDVHSKVIIVGLLVYRAESIKKLPRKLKKSLNIINPKKVCEGIHGYQAIWLHDLQHYSVRFDRYLWL